MMTPARMMFWRAVARLLDLGLLTVRPSWPEVKYKINSRLAAARSYREWKRLHKTEEYRRFKNWHWRWMAGHVEANRKRERKNATRVRLDALLSRPIAGNPTS